METLTNTTELDKLPVPQIVARRLQDMIRNGVYAPDERLPSQRDLAEKLGASRASVREALLSLETLGLIRTLPARGTFVAGKTDKRAIGPLSLKGADVFRLEDVFETRSLIEGELAASAAQHVTDRDIDRLKALQRDFRQLWEDGDLVSHVNADLQFHQSLAEISPNTLLRQIYTTFSDFLTESQRLPIPMTDNARMQQSMGEHDAIIDALQKRDPDRARQSMRQHIRATAKCAGVSDLGF